MTNFVYIAASLDGAREFTVEKVERLTDTLVQTTYRRVRKHE